MYDEFIEGLSKERFQTYLNWANQDIAKALELYLFNAKICAEFYLPLQSFEICLRNRICSLLSTNYGDDWIVNKLLFPKSQINKINQAKEKLSRNQKLISHPNLIANLSFGFWEIFGTRYHKKLWDRFLYQVAQKPDGKFLSQNEFARIFHNLKYLRNRIAHHEPIITLPLDNNWQELVKLLSWVSPQTANWCQKNCDLDQKIDKWQLLKLEHFHLQ